MTKPAHPSAVSPYLLLTLTTLFWAGNWVVGRGIRNDVPPIALSFWRWAIALAVLMPWAWPRLRAQWSLILAHRRQLAVLGVFGGACHNALTYIGLSLTSATNGVLLASATPVMILLLSAVLLRARIRPGEWIGVLVSFIGVGGIVARGDLTTLAALSVNAGDLWVLAAMLFWALYTVLLTRRPAALDAVAFLAVISFFGLVALLPFYAFEIARGQLIRPGLAAYAAMAYAGIFPALLGFVFWNRAVAEVGAARSGVFMHLMPAFGTALAVLFLGERPALYHLIGISLILAGIALTTRGPARSN